MKQTNAIQLSDHFTYGKLFRFTLPSVIMMIFTSIYSVVDGLFISNVVGSSALSSINIVYPIIIVVGAFGFMLGGGGSAEVSKTFGMGQPQKANRYFTMIICAILAIGIGLSAAGILFIRPISYALGADDSLIEGCVVYGGILLFGCTAFMLQTTFQTFFVAAEKPHIGLFLTIASGVTNMVLDFLFIWVFHWGLAGAAWATVCGYLVGGVIPLVYFLLPNSSRLRLTRPCFYPRVFLRSCANGVSNLLSNLSASVTTFLYNFQMMRIAGAEGVAAITVIMYVSFIFIAILSGFSMGTAPVVSYHYGAQNRQELKNMLHKCLTVVAGVSICMVVLAQSIAVPLVNLFVGKEPALAQMTVHGFRLYSLSFLLCGANIYLASFFTALCNGAVAATISFLRSLVLQTGMLLLLPLLLGLDGIWLAVVVTEAVTVCISLFFLLQQRKKYGYL